MFWECSIYEWKLHTTNKAMKIPTILWWGWNILGELDQYHDCWWPISLHCQVISGYEIMLDISNFVPMREVFRDFHHLGIGENKERQYKYSCILPKPIKVNVPNINVPFNITWFYIISQSRRCIISESQQREKSEHFRYWFVTRQWKRLILEWHWPKTIVVSG